MEFVILIATCFLVFVMTSAYYRYQIRRFYIYVGEYPMAEISENLDPRKKISDKGKNEYKKILYAGISQFLNRGKQGR